MADGLQSLSDVRYNSNSLFLLLAVVYCCLYVLTPSRACLTLFLLSATLYLVHFCGLVIRVRSPDELAIFCFCFLESGERRNEVRPDKHLCHSNITGGLMIYVVIGTHDGPKNHVSSLRLPIIFCSHYYQYVSP